MALLPQQVNGDINVLRESIHQRRQLPLLQRRGEAFTPDGQFVLSISVITIAFVSLLSVTVALYLRRRNCKYNHYIEPASPDNGADHDDLRTWIRWGRLSKYAPRRLFRQSSVVEITAMRTDAPRAVNFRPRELSGFVTAPTKRPAVMRSEQFPIESGAQSEAMMPPAAVELDGYSGPLGNRQQ